MTGSSLSIISSRPWAFSAVQGELHSEKMRNKTLRYTLMNMQDDSLSALNKALIPATSAQNLPSRMQSSSQVIPKLLAEFSKWHDWGRIPFVADTDVHHAAHCVPH